MGIVVETSAGGLEGVQEEGLPSFRGIPFVFGSIGRRGAQRLGRPPRA